MRWGRLPGTGYVGGCTASDNRVVSQAFKESFLYLAPLDGRYQCRFAMAIG